MPLQVIQGTGGNANTITPVDGVCYVYVNEIPAGENADWGRTITVRPQSAGTLSVAPDHRCSASAPTGTYTIEAGGDNFNAGSPDNNTRVVSPRGLESTLGQGARESYEHCQMRFRTSRYGLDGYEVTLGSESVEIEVWKRIQCTYKEMSRPGSSGGTFQIRRALERVVTHLANEFGIELVLPSGTPPSVPHQSPIALSSLQSHFGVSGARERQLWIGSVDRFSTSALGYGGNNIAICSHSGLIDLGQQYRDIFQDWISFRDSRQANADYDDWHQARRITDRDERLMRNYIAQQGEEVIPDLIREHGFLLLLHEVGHALGLVPSSGEAAWHDSANSNHCQSQECAMYWRTESGQGNPTVRARSTDHNPLDTHCQTYLTECDLSDIENVLI
jgi:hypothetical protein